MNGTAELDLVRDGTQCWRDLVATLDDAELDAPTLLEGWTRRHLIAHVAFNARALGRLTEWARTGVEHPMYASQEARDEEIARGAELTGEQLRRLDRESAEALATGWDALPADRWEAEVRTRQGTMIPVRQTVWMRAREVWIHAADLDAGFGFADMPEEFLEQLFVDVVGSLRARESGRRFVVSVEGRPDLEASTSEDSSAESLRISGPLWAVVAWASGRGGEGLASGSEVPAPTWL
ncbi:maleylpyruvate isomerase family mycothiol-dependent enzyme [Nesterenkonia marinintestina]|uniref:maleylpyruvate isomerase family mycothiol-dependent enzyme n=1 Tax=Nesterenkonia marinintestina TaxID=2979865 RepID=UPI0021BF558E|nr:maleylpyruvate isomerase family mycothiol-dependent enzyme [Nesterenkonia sp. GX14115]